MSLKELRERNNLSQVQVAEDLGWDRLKYNRWENNVTKTFTANDILKLADYFSISTDTLIKELIHE